MKYLKSYNESIRDKMIPKPKEEINKIIGDISSLSYKSLPKDYLEESSAVGSFDASYNDLVKMFGEPLYNDWSWKTTMEWFIKDKDGRIYRIYDWKVAEWANIEFDDNDTIDEMKEKVKNYIKEQDTFHWMIGGVSADGVEDLKKYILYHTLNESLRDKMTPKSKDDIRIAVKNNLGIDNDYIEVKLPEPKDIKKTKTVLNLSDKYNLDIKDYKDDNILICGDIVDVFNFMEIYLNYALINKRNRKRFHIEYITDNIINDNLTESIRDKMTPKSKEEILKDLDYDPDVSYKPTKKSGVGTWLIGEYITDYDTLVKLFGEPEKHDWIGNNFYWKLIGNNGRVVTIYDNNIGLEADELMNKEYKWHIGGTDPQDANNLIAYIIINTK